MQGQNEVLTVSLILEKTSKTSEEMKATAEKICSLSAKFLPIMKQKANDVIESYMREKRCGRKDAIEAINSFRRDRPLAELLDEYNWITYYV